MKKFYAIIAFMTLGMVQAFSQTCTPPTPTGTAHVNPSPSAIPCIILGQEFDQTLEIENISSYTTGTTTITMDSIIVDTVQNLPCGINYVINTNPAHGNKIVSGATACINVHGFTADSVGQYPLGLILSVYIKVNGFPVSLVHKSPSQIAATLATFNLTLPFDFNFYFRVSNCTSNCIAADTTANAHNLTASCNVPFKANIATSSCTAVCTGSVDTLKAATFNTDSLVTYRWVSANTGTVLGSASSVAVTAPDSVLLVAIDHSVTDTIRFNVPALPLPTASDSIVSTDTVSVTALNTTVGNTSTLYIVDSVNRSIVDSTTASTAFTHTFTANGTYYVYTVAHNNCGNDTTQNQVVHITGIHGVGIAGINNIGALVNIYPNPSNGEVNLKIFSAVSSTENYTVKIYNTQGQEVYTQPFIGNINKAIDLSYLNAGVYLVHINSTNLSTVQRLIIK